MIKKIITIAAYLVSACMLYLNTAIAENSGNSPSYLSLSLEELGKIKISIATGNEILIEDAPAIASVITAKQIKAMGARTLNEALKVIPGLHLSLSGLNRTDAIYSIRGIHNSSFNPQVLLLLDGTPITWPSQGGRPTRFSLPTSNIKHIEVIRGPGSAIYGADAFSGVINVITKHAED
ncbi:MAG: TonB-dependent receptor plug domain-containing protein, partial [Cellvibrionaceae bacterium]|nr:TonB-dependent receptor plug domain-containing protein [Cellvibrionaceae bacterium]